MEENFSSQTLSTQENVAGVKERLQKEGREARNLIAYSLPLESWKISFSSSSNDKDAEKLNKRSAAKEKKIVENARFKQSKRHRSASAGRDPQACLRARHWGFLFRNLQQAVDEIYQTAEDDESIIECKEAILMLERYTNDFYKLIEWFKIKWEYESSSPPRHPTSLAWEIRTSSPGKIFKYERRRNAAVGDSKKTLSFNEPCLSDIVKEKTESIPQTCDSSNAQKIIPTINIISGEKNPCNSASLSNGKKTSDQKSYRQPNEMLLEQQFADKEIDNNEIGFISGSIDNKSVVEKKSTCLKPYNLNSDLKGTTNKENLASPINGSTTLSQTLLSQNKPSVLYASKLKDNIADSSNFTNESIEKNSPKTNLKEKIHSEIDHNTDINREIANIDTTIRNNSKEPKKNLTEAGQKKPSTYQTKHLHSKPGPLVNMNKASQVRQAFNQNKTPIKNNSENGWKQHYSLTFSENKVDKASVSFDGRGTPSIYLSSSSNPSSSFIRGQSWADKVKGNAVLGVYEEKAKLSKLFIKDGDDKDDNEGWEVVRRHKRNHGGSVGSVNSKLSSKSTLCDMAKKVKYPLKMKSRFDHPSSAVSLPSLHSSCDVNERLEGNSLPGYCFITQNWNVNSKESKQNVKKLHNRNKRFQKETSDVSCVKNSNYYKLYKITCMDDSHCKTTVFNQETKNKEGNIDNEKLKKDAANAKTQSGSSLFSSRENEDQFETHLKLSSNENLVSGTASFHEKMEEYKANIGIFDIENSSSKAVEDSFKSKENSSLASKIGLPRRLFCPSNISESQSGNESETEEEKLRCNAEAFEFAIEREKKLKEEIEETKNAPIEICSADDEDGDTDIDSYEIFGCNTEAHSQNEMCNLIKNDFGNASLQAGFLNWADEMDEIDKVESIRPPGRVLHIHEKLSSPSRKLPISEKLRRHKEKLAKAQELRGKLMLAKTEKLKDLFRKIDEVNIDKERLLLEKRDLFERKMERAEEKRRVHLQEIINKAHDEENKAKEIAFINGLEAQNKLHDIMQQHQIHESRMADMAEERSRKLEEKAAKEAAAQERRKALEEERKARMLELCEKRRKRYERIDRQQAERREELLEQAREKARDREERRSALQQAQQAKECELVKKIQQKQEETARRHEENIEQIRQRALESSIMKYSRGCDEAPNLKRYETKKVCTLCNSVIASEVYLLSHLRSFQHEESLKVLNKRDISLEESETFNLKYIVNAPANIVDSQVIKDRERLKALKKRCRKIRTRMASRGREFLKTLKNPLCKDSVTKNRISKSLTQIGKLFSSQGTGPWLAADVSLLDKNLLELLRILEKNDDEQIIFASLDGFRRLMVILDLIMCEEETPCVIPSRSLSNCAKILNEATKNSYENSHFLLFSNFVGNIIDQLNRRLNEMSLEFSRNGSLSSLNSIALLPSDPAATSLMELLSQILHDSKSENNCSEMEKNCCWTRSQDVVSYCVSMGVTDKISWYFNHVQNPVESDPSSADIILSATGLLSALSEKLCERSQCDDPTQLIETFRVLDACGVISLLYGLLLHQGGRSSTPPPVSLLSSSTLAISAAATTLLYRLAELNLEMFQSILGSEGISLEFRHIASFLIWYCTHWPCEEILHNVISLVGFFAINNRENQSIIQSGETPSVLQQLCSLPWQYFSEPTLTDVLFPTLLACCLNNNDNLNILQQEMSFQILEDYLKTNKTSKNIIMQILCSLYTN